MFIKGFAVIIKQFVRNVNRIRMNFVVQKKISAVSRVLRHYKKDINETYHSQ